MARSDIAWGDEEGFRAGLAARPELRHVYGLTGYHTEADLRAFFDGKTTLFDEVQAWLADEVHDGVLARQDDMRAVFWIALEADRDVMAFHLRWSEHLVDHTV